MKRLLIFRSLRGRSGPNARKKGIVAANPQTLFADSVLVLGLYANLVLFLCVEVKTQQTAAWCLSPKSHPYLHKSSRTVWETIKDDC